MEKDQQLELLQKHRDEHYDGDWSTMLKDLKERIKSTSCPSEKKSGLRKDIQKIEIVLGLRPEEGYQYVNSSDLHFRIPRSITLEALRRSKNKLKELCDIDNKGRPQANHDLYPAYISTREIIYMINTYGFDKKSTIPLPPTIT